MSTDGSCSLAVIDSNFSTIRAYGTVNRKNKDDLTDLNITETSSIPAKPGLIIDTSSTHIGSLNFTSNIWSLSTKKGKERPILEEY